MMWDEHPECKGVVAQGWNQQKKTFKNAAKEIPKLKAKLQELQNSVCSEEVIHQISGIKKQLTEYWKREEYYWGQRSRLKWLKWGDKNTSFFHATTIQRRSRNRLARIKDGQGNWVMGQKKVMEAATDYFKSVQKTRKASWIWSSILQGRDFIKRNAQWMIAKGEDVNIWHDKWVRSGDSLKPYCQGDETQVSALIDPSQKTWNKVKVRELVPPELAIKIIQTPISLYQEKDSLVWPFSSDGVYSIKTDLKKDPISFKFQLSLLAYTLWAIWKQRNNQVFRYQKPSPTTAIVQASTLAIEYYMATKECIQLNNYRNQVGAIAVIVRDYHGKLLTGLAKKIQAPSPLLAEALALREAITAAYNFNWSRVVFESDFQILIEACRRERSVAQIKLIVKDILTVASGFFHCGFTWVQRLGNSAAHKVAQACLSDSLASCWSGSPPPWLQDHLDQDSSRILHRPHLEVHQRSGTRLGDEYPP
ncbi:Ribonuclease H-like superfamily [Sesbania bispinosa]|nr:Ribonuclease H-like superfamily [Sesbania bispinosa]